MNKTLIKLITVIVLIALLAGILIAFSGNSGNSGASGASVTINEVMSKNDGSVPDPNGKYYDWVELYNSSNKDADISGMGLSDDPFSGVKFVFPQGTVVPADGYIVVYCSGEAATGLYAPFKLSASDAISLYNIHGGLIQSIKLQAVDSGKTLARIVNSDIWEAQDPSPGYPNTPEGVAAFRSTEIAQEGEDIGVYINEFQASNRSTIPDINGEYSDWIELYNSNDTDVDLSGYGISDDLNRPSKFVIPDGVTISAKGYLLIFCSGNDGILGEGESAELHAPFGLRANKEDVVFSNPQGHVLDSYSYTLQEPDASMARTADGTGEFSQTFAPTPGFPNTESGYEEFSQKYALPLGDLYISEAMGSNSKLLPTTIDGTTQYPDWLEITNAGTDSINLSGYALSDNANNPAKWVFPEITIAPGQYIVVLATGKSDKTTSPMHANFSISADGEALFLFDPEGTMIDKFRISSFLQDMSVGRSSDGQVKLYRTPTPGAANSDSSAYLGFSDAPVFDIVPGIYDEDSITVTISVPDTETVYYTLDCTTPTTNSTRYDGNGITISKNTVIRALGYREGYYCDFATVSGTFLFTHDEADHALPVMTIVTDPDNLWDYNTGIYLREGAYFRAGDTWPYESANYFKEDWERPAGFSIFDESGREEFSQNVGIKIAGGFGCGREQKGIAVIARDEYGKNTMVHKFFPDLEYTEYKALMLRCGAQDQTMTKFRDEFNVELLKGYDVNFIYMDYKPYVLYLNGEYWGVYYLREKRNRFYVAQHEGLDSADNIDLMKSETRYQSGSPAEWTAIMDYVRSHDLNDPKAYAYVEERIDLDSFMDYMICEIYVGNTDIWNIQYYKTPGGKWKWIYYDFCWSWWEADSNTIASRRNSSAPMSDLFNALLDVPEWQDAFLRRFAELMNTVFEPTHVTESIDKFYNIVEPEIERERSVFNTAGYRVGGHNLVDPDNVASYEGFRSHVARLRKFAENRRAAIRRYIKLEFNLSDAYMQEVFG